MMDGSTTTRRPRRGVGGGTEVPGAFSPAARADVGPPRGVGTHLFWHVAGKRRHVGYRCGRGVAGLLHAAPGWLGVVAAGVVRARFQGSSPRVVDAPGVALNRRACLKSRRSPDSVFRLPYSPGRVGRWCSPCLRCCSAVGSGPGVRAWPISPPPAASCAVARVVIAPSRVIVPLGGPD